jgi:hypothetical protein
LKHGDGGPDEEPWEVMLARVRDGLIHILHDRSPQQKDANGSRLKDTKGNPTER